MSYQPNDQPDPAPVEDNLSDHNYDGIQEYDNPTPGWWNWLFIATIIMAPIYLVIFHSPYSDRSVKAQYDRANNANLKLQFEEIGELEGDAETILKYKDDPKWIAVGKATFATNCVSCHGKKAEGLSGPNLTDDSYLHVKQVEDIARVIHDGAKAGAMPAWGNRLHPNEVVLAAAYVASLRGTNVAGKGPEGNAIDPWPSASPAE